MKKALSSSIALLAFALAACNDNHTSPTMQNPLPAAPTAGATMPPSDPPTVARAETSRSEAPASDDLHHLETDGARIVKAEHGDLNADGRLDVLVVLDRPAVANAPNERPVRTVQLLIRAAEGHLQRAAQNDKIIPCSTCGGLAGDPFSFAHINKDRFTLVMEGGSREHWWDSYTFRYAADQAGWLLDKVERGVTDTQADITRKITLTPSDFGTVSFDAFDPETLPTVKLP